MSGTSMASPQVTGIVAQLLQKYPGATQQQMRDLIINYSLVDVLANTLPDSYTSFTSLKRGYSRYAYQPFNDDESFSILGSPSLTNASLKL
jgi:subtilisin family serine protease